MNHEDVKVEADDKKNPLPPRTLTWVGQLDKKWTYYTALRVLRDIRLSNAGTLELHSCKWFREIVESMPVQGPKASVAVDIAKDRIIEAFEQELRRR